MSLLLFLLLLLLLLSNIQIMYICIYMYAFLFSVKIILNKCLLHICVKCRRNGRRYLYPIPEVHILALRYVTWVGRVAKISAEADMSSKTFLAYIFVLLVKQSFSVPLWMYRGNLLLDAFHFSRKSPDTFQMLELI